MTRLTVTFQSLGDGILNSGVQTIRAAIDVQKAAAIAAGTPMATGYIKNNGADLDPKEVQGLLNAWKNARNNRSTAYLTSTLEYTPVSFSPKEMMYNEAIQNLATEIARLCNVPAYYVSAEMNNSMTYSNVQDERKQFLASSLPGQPSAEFSLTAKWLRIVRLPEYHDGKPRQVRIRKVGLQSRT